MRNATTHKQIIEDLEAEKLMAMEIITRLDEDIYAEYDPTRQLNLERRKGKLEGKIKKVNQEIRKTSINWLGESLMNLDYIEPFNRYVQLFSKHRLAAFLIHGNSDRYGSHQGRSVRILCTKLFRGTDNIKKAPKLQIDLIIQSQCRSIEELWNRLAVGLGIVERLPLEEKIERISEEICKTGAVLVCRVSGPIDDPASQREHLTAVIQEFWETLAKAVLEHRKATAFPIPHITIPHIAIPTATNHGNPPALETRGLLLFLIDYGGYLIDVPMPCVESMEVGDKWSPTIPVRLPPMIRFRETDLDSWMKEHRMSLRKILPTYWPENPQAQDIQAILDANEDGNPDRVIQYIWTECGYEMEALEICLEKVF